ncbi:MAG: hypothetical protein SGJ27_26730 [Candidatus Melainabacteria bacterium]|nr:hypothetical protein [Candidatus Melainabacteria bacterium]
MNGIATLPSSISDKFRMILSHRFDNIFTRYRHDELGFKRVVDLFRKHGLLTVVSPSPFKPVEIEVDESRLDDARYRRWLIKKLKAPRPSKNVFHTLQIDRVRLVEDDYRAAFSDFLGASLESRLGTVEGVELAVLIRMTSDILIDGLDKLKLFELTPEMLAQFALRKFTEQAIDNSPHYQKAVAMIRDVAEQERQKLRASMAVFNQQLMADFDESNRAIMADVNRRADAYIADMRARQAERQAKEDEESAPRRALEAANAGKTEQEIFRESVIRREREWRAANRMSTKARVLLWSTVSVVAVALAAFLEVDGATLLDVVKPLFD